MIASAGVATAMSYELPPDTRTPEQIEADAREREVNEARYRALRSQEHLATAKLMMDESEPFLKLIGERIKDVTRTAAVDTEEIELVVDVVTESGVRLRLTPVSHDFDGGEPSIKAEVIGRCT